MFNSPVDSSRYRAGFAAVCLDQAPPSARRWYEGLCSVVQADVEPHAARVDRTGAYPAKAVSALCRIGAFGITVPERETGLGFTDAMAALAVETVAAACPSTAAVMMFHYQVVRRVDLFGAKSWRAADLEKLASGAWLASSAWTELGAGADKSSLATRLENNQGQLVVHGAKHFCTGLEGAGLIHVLLDAAPKGGKPASTFVRVPVDRAGVDRSEIYPLLGLRGSSTGTVGLNGVEVEEDCVVGRVGQGGALMRANHEFFMNPGLIALGVASAAFEAACDGALGHGPGARDISGFQATRFRLAEMETRLARAYALAADTVHLAASKRPVSPSDFLRVKLAASETAVDIANDALRLAGGKGFHADWPYERHLRDAYATVLMGPTNEIIKERIAERLIADNDIHSDSVERMLERAL